MSKSSWEMVLLVGVPLLFGIICAIYLIGFKTWSSLKIGYGSVDITPSLGTELGGYGYFTGRKARKILDPLYARAVLFNKGKKELLLIDCDLIGLDKTIVASVKDQLHKEMRIEKTNILLFSTHTHTGPATNGTVGLGEQDRKYMEVLPELLVRAAKQAYDNRRKVKQAKQFVKEVDGVGYNRVKPLETIDKNVRGMTFYFDKGMPLVLISYGCHPVTLGPANVISADYPGRVVRELEKEGYQGIFLNGLFGDVDPIVNLDAWGSGTEETCNEYGRIISKAFTDVITKAEVMDDLSIDAFDISVKLQSMKMRSEDIYKVVENHAQDRETNPGKYKLVCIWAKAIEKYLVQSQEPYADTLNVQFFKIGKVLISGFPVEMFNELGNPVRDVLPEINVMIICNANATMRYLTTRADIENNGYAGMESSFFNMNLPLVAGEGERFTKEVAKQLTTKLMIIK